MALLVVCPSCKQRLTFPDLFAGRQVQCPGCMSDVQVTADNKVPDAPAKPASAAKGPAKTDPGRGAGAGAIKKESASRAPARNGSRPQESGRGPRSRSRDNLEELPLEELPQNEFLEELPSERDNDYRISSPYLPRRKSGGKAVWVTLLVILLLGGLGAGGFFLIQALNKEDPPPPIAALKDKDGDKEKKDKGVDKDKTLDKDKRSDKGGLTEKDKAVATDKSLDKDKTALTDKSLDKDKIIEKEKGVVRDKGGVPIVVGPEPKAGEPIPAHANIKLAKLCRGLVVNKAGTVAYAMCGDGTLHFIDLERDAETETISFGADFKIETLLDGLALSPDEKNIAFGYDKNSLFVIDLDKKSGTKYTLPADTFGVRQLGFSPDGKHLLVLHTPQRLRVLDLEKKNFNEIMDGLFPIQARGFVFSADGSILALAWDGNDMAFFDAKALPLGKLIAKEKANPEVPFIPPTSSETAIAASADGALVAAGFERNLRFWELPSRKQQAPLKLEGVKPGDTSPMPFSAAFYASGSRIAVGTDRGAAYLYQTATGQRRAVLNTGTTNRVLSVAVTAGDKKLVCRSDHAVHIWDLAKVPLDPEEKTVVRVDPGKDKKVDPVGPTPKGGKGAADETIALGQPLRNFALNRDGSLLYCLVLDGSIKVYDMKDRSLKETISPPPGRKIPTDTNLGALAFSPDGRRLARGIHNVILEVIDLNTKISTQLCDEKESYDLRYLAFVSDLELASRSHLGVTRIWDLTTRKTILDTQDLFKGEVSTLALAVSPDGSYLVIPKGSTVRVLWSDGKSFFTDKVTEDTFARNDASAFSRDGKRFAIAFGHNLHVWHLPGKKERAVSFDLKAGLPGAPSSVGGPLAFFKDGNRIAATTNNGTVQLLDVLTGQRRANLETGVAGESRCVAVTPDDQLLLVGAGDQVAVFKVASIALEPENPALASIADPDLPLAKLDRKMPKFPLPKDPFGKDPLGKLPFPPKFPVGGGIEEKITFAGKVDPLHGALIDPDGKTALIVQAKSGVKVMSYPDFKPKAAWRLPATVQRAVFDRAKGLMYALVRGKDTSGKRGGAQIMVFDLRDVMDSKVKPTPSKDLFNPVRSFDLPAFCTHIALSPGGDSLYCLENKLSKAARALRVGVEKGEVMAETPLHELSDGMALAPDGKHLYVISRTGPRTGAKAGGVTGKLHVIDTADMKAAVIEIPIDPNDLDANNDGLVFVSGYAGAPVAEVLIVDSNNKDKAVVATWKGIPAASCIRLDESGRRLFVRNTKNAKVSSGAAIVLPPVLPDSELPRATWGLGPATATRGEFLLTPDGRYLICESGTVFFIGVPEGLPGLGGLGGFGVP
ncbi:MAG: hypothetical protein U0793_01515 [Gemmataceae bacterium]